MKKLTLSVAFLASMLAASAAFADDASVAKSKSFRGVVDLPPTEITSPPMRPLATVDIARLEPRLTISMLRQPLLGRIEAALFTDRF